MSGSAVWTRRQTDRVKRAHATAATPSEKNSDMMLQINKPNNNDVKKESSITITKISPSNLVTKKNHIHEFLTNQSINEIKTVDSMLIHNKFPRLKTQELELSEIWQNLCETCNTIEKSQVPVCIWSQDENNIYLNFNILKIDNFSVNCTMQSIMFDAQYNDVSYTFCAILYGYIRPKIIHTINVDGVCIHIKKLYTSKSEWPRLFACKKIHKYVKHYDSKCIETKKFTIWTKALNWFKMMTGTMIQL